MSNIKKGSKLTVSTANGISRATTTSLGVLEVSGPSMSDITASYSENTSQFAIGATDVSGSLKIGINNDGNTFIDAITHGSHKDIILQKYGGNTIFGSGLNSTAKVGIGTTNPQAKLHIQDLNDTTLKIESGNNTSNKTANIVFRTDDTGNAQAHYDTAKIVSGFDGTAYTTSYIAFQTHHENNSSWYTSMKIKGGNVGIGATIPYAKLQISGTSVDPSTLTQSTTNSQGILRLNGTGGVFMDFGFQSSSPYAGWIQTHNGSTNGVGDDLLLQPVSGNVGINTTNASGGALHVVGNIYSTGKILGEVGGSNLIVGGTTYQSATAPTNGMLVEGNVGIGTTSPYSKLHVNGNITLDACRTGSSYPTGSVGGGISFRAGAAYAPDSSIGAYNCSILTYAHDQTTDGLSINGYDGVSFCTGSSTRNERMRINSSGNVGIGTTNPTGAKLVVNGSSIIGIYLMGDYTDYNYILSAPLPGYTTGGAVHFINSPTRTDAGAGGAGCYIIRNDSGPITLGRTEYGTTIKGSNITLDGNVGIGTTDPGNYKLNVNGTIYASGSITSSVGIFLGTGYKLSWSSHGYIEGNNGYINFATWGVRRMSILDGNVGIGTTSPGAKLHIKGGDLRIERPDTEVPRIELIRNNSSKNFGGDNYQDWAIQNSGGKFQIISGHSTNGDTIVLSSDGTNVGIGTTSPNAPLHIFSKEGEPTNHIKDMIKIETEYNDFDDSNREGGASILFYVENHNGGDGQGFPGEAARIVAGCDELSNANEYHSYLAFHTSNNSSSTGTTEQMVIRHNGNVGIGVANPSYRLVVNTASAETKVQFGTGGNDYGTVMYIGGGSINQRKLALISEPITPIAYCRSDLHFCLNTSNANNDVTLSDSKMVIKNNGNVGIGTTDPKAKLNVEDGGFLVGGIDNVTQQGCHIQWNRSGQHGETHIINNIGEATNNGVSSGIKFAMTDSNGTVSDKMFIRNDGNVGIGTTDPKNKLDVEGAAVIGATYSGTNTAPTNGLLVEGDVGIGTTDTSQPSNEPRLIVKAGRFGTIAAFKNVNDTIVGTIYASSQGKGAFFLYDDTGTKKFHLSTYDDSYIMGNVGIGTTDPDVKLDVNGDIISRGNQISIGYENTSISTGYCYFTGKNANITRFQGDKNIQLWAQDGDIEFHTASTNTHKMIIDAAGNVGIGTTNPQYNLDTNGSGRFTTSGNTTGVIVKRSNVALVLGNDGGGGNTGNIQVWSDATNSGITGSTPYHLGIQYYGGILQLGKYNDSQYYTQIRGQQVNLRGLSLWSSLTNASSRPSITTSNNASSVDRTIANYEIRGVPSGSNYHSALANDSGFLRLRAGGGINANTTSYIDITGYSTNSDMDENIVFGTNGTERMRIVEGNVGIGTTNPDSLLHVYTNENRGVANTTNKTMLTIQSSPSDDCNVYNFNPISIDFNMSNQVNNPGIARIASLIAPTGSLGPNDALGESSSALTFSTQNGTTLGERMRIRHDGNVGIGTTNPQAKLELYDNTVGSSSTLILKRNVTTYTGSDDGAAIEFQTYYPSNTTSYLQSRIRGFDDNLGGVGSGAGGIAFDTYYVPDGNNVYSERMRITSQGNVGIGTTIPQAKLDVNGTAKFANCTWTQNNGTYGSVILTGKQDGGYWGIQLGDDTNAPKLMCDGDHFGLYFDGPGEWGMYSSVHAATQLAYNGSTKLKTMNDGTAINGNLFVDGHIGINTTSYTQPLVIMDTTNMPNASYSLLFGSRGRGWLGVGTQNWYSHDGGVHRPLSVYSQGGIWIGSGAYFASSDRRIKMNIVDVSDNQALEMIRNIPCRYYEYKDKISRGIGNTIGFIAQEVREVMPMAINLETGIIPSEGRNLIDISWNGSTLYSDLSDCSGVKYRFYVGNDLSSNDIMKDVVGNSDNSFTFDQSWNYVFCYGKEVDDFHTVDKNKLFALNFSATQEIDRIQQQEITKVQTLQTDISNANTIIQTHEATIQQQATTIQEQATTIQEQATTIQEQATTIQEQATKITTLETQIADILTRLSNLENSS